MRDAQPARPVRLSEYRPPAFLVDHIDLVFTLDERETRVQSTLSLRRNPERTDAPADCVLDGEGLTLEELRLDGKVVEPGGFTASDETLVIHEAPERFELETRVLIRPETNTALEGLYLSGGMLTTQCEAQGFRRITWFPDRPDVLARFTTTLYADPERYPLLLSNGNPVASGREESRGLHWVRWEDPFPKPCYLFALVAGDLAMREDRHVTASGREITLRIYAEHRDLDKLGHAMDSLRRAMAWDEARYGREYDLDLYQIVAVSHFNMGAMENKGLNIFNTACVLAHPDTTTDAGFERVESVVAHEYFHNWSGNRVTCRDWFQLSLKEGFTVFRDQQFSEDMNSAAVNRIENVRMLRTMQFPEDQGPMAHPVRPAEYYEIDNFYTLTVYEKGAELVRMQYHLLGPERFRAATDLYFSRFDGKAVTCDDFVDCMEEAAGMDLSVFRHWYSQAGTPRLRVREAYDNGVWTLWLSQHTPPTPGQAEKAPVMIPVRMGLLSRDGTALPVDDAGNNETVLVLDEEEKRFSFPAEQRPVPSLLRGFSAPVELDREFTDEELVVLLAHDSDGYVRWDAAQRLFFRTLEAVMEDADVLDARVQALVPALRQVIERAEDDPAAAALLLELPSEVAIGDRLDEIRVDSIHQAREGLQRALGQALQANWQMLVDAMEVAEPWRPEPQQIGRRSLRQRALEYLAAAGEASLPKALVRQYREADNMSERLGALRILVHHDLAGSAEALGWLHEQGRDEPLVMDQWFAIQVARPAPDTLERAVALLEHEDFDWMLPNRVRAVLGTLVGANPVAFHRADGAGYRVLADALKRLDGINPQVAARLAGACARLARLPEPRQALLRAAMEDIRRQGCSGNLREVLERILGKGTD